jgi:hypothetical protein
MFMRTSIRWHDVRPVANGDDVQMPINAPKPYAQQCVVYSDSETWRRVRGQQTVELPASDVKMNFEYSRAL